MVGTQIFFEFINEWILPIFLTLLGQLSESYKHGKLNQFIHTLEGIPDSEQPGAEDLLGLLGWCWGGDELTGG